MASRFETFSKGEIFVINEAVLQTNTQKTMNFGLSVFTGRQRIIFMLNLQINRKNVLDKIPEMLVLKLQTKFLLSDVFNLRKVTFFHFCPTDVVNTKTTIPLRVDEQCQI